MIQNIYIYNMIYIYTYNLGNHNYSLMIYLNQIIGAASQGMAFNPEYCVVVDNDDFKNGAKIQLFPDTQGYWWMVDTMFRWTVKSHITS